MKRQRSRKPFIAPSIKEQASLVGVTLISGGHGGRRYKGGKEHDHSSDRRHGGRDG